VRYSLGTVKANIQDDPHNRTRFAVIGSLQAGPSGEDRTSLALAAPHKAGSIYRLLGSLAQHGVSMTRFESRPARTGTWEYYFYVDVQGHTQDPAVASALAELQSNAAFFKVLGSYPVSLT
jgi:chorismate mutase/prephenate dehydratase